MKELLKDKNLKCNRKIKENGELRLDGEYDGRIISQDMIMHYPCIVVFDKSNDNFYCIHVPDLTENHEVYGVYISE